MGFETTTLAARRKCMRVLSIKQKR